MTNMKRHPQTQKDDRDKQRHPDPPRQCAIRRTPDEAMSDPLPGWLPRSNKGSVNLGWCRTLLEYIAANTAARG